MFGVYFGNYLCEKGRLSKEQAVGLIEEMKGTRLKLGTIAVAEGIMTVKQAEEVNAIQAREDRRFGDIAISLGYMTEKDLSLVLSKQGDPYLLYLEILQKHDIVKQEEMTDLLADFRKSSGFTNYEMEALKSGDIDRIVPIFTQGTDIPVEIKDYIALAARNIVRFIDNNVRFGYIKKVSELKVEKLSYQAIKGDYIFEAALGASGDDSGMRKAASVYGREEFEKVDEDALDALCEFINVSNGLYARDEGEYDIVIDMEPPMMKCGDISISLEEGFYIIPFYISESRVDLILSKGSELKIEG